MNSLLFNDHYVAPAMDGGAPEENSALLDEAAMRAYATNKTLLLPPYRFAVERPWVIDDKAGLHVEMPNCAAGNDGGGMVWRGPPVWDDPYSGTSRPTPFIRIVNSSHLRFERLGFVVNSSSYPCGFIATSSTIVDDPERPHSVPTTRTNWLQCVGQSVDGQLLGGWHMAKTPNQRDANDSEQLIDRCDVLNVGWGGPSPRDRVYFTKEWTDQGYEPCGAWVEQSQAKQIAFKGCTMTGRPGDRGAHGTGVTVDQGTITWDGDGGGMAWFRRCFSFPPRHGIGGGRQRIHGGDYEGNRGFILAASNPNSLNPMEIHDIRYARNAMLDGDVIFDFHQYLGPIRLRQIGIDGDNNGVLDCVVRWYVDATTWSPAGVVDTPASLHLEDMVIRTNHPIHQYDGVMDIWQGSNRQRRVRAGAVTMWHGDLPEQMVQWKPRRPKQAA